MCEDARVLIAVRHPEAVQVTEVSERVKLKAMTRKAPVDDSLVVEHVLARGRERMEPEVIRIRLEHSEESDRTRAVVAPRLNGDVVEDGGEVRGTHARQELQDDPRTAQSQTVTGRFGSRQATAGDRSAQALDDRAAVSSRGRARR